MRSLSSILGEHRLLRFAGGETPEAQQVPQGPETRQEGRNMESKTAPRNDDEVADRAHERQQGAEQKSQELQTQLTQMETQLRELKLDEATATVVSEAGARLQQMFEQIATAARTIREQQGAAPKVAEAASQVETKATELARQSGELAQRAKQIAESKGQQINTLEKAGAGGKGAEGEKGKVGENSENQQEALTPEQEQIVRALTLADKQGGDTEAYEHIARTLPQELAVRISNGMSLSLQNVTGLRQAISDLSGKEQKIVGELLHMPPGMTEDEQEKLMKAVSLDDQLAIVEKSMQRQGSEFKESTAVGKSSPEAIDLLQKWGFKNAMEEGFTAVRELMEQKGVSRPGTFLNLQAKGENLVVNAVSPDGNVSETVIKRSDLPQQKEGTAINADTFADVKAEYDKLQPEQRDALAKMFRDVPEGVVKGLKPEEKRGAISLASKLPPELLAKFADPTSFTDKDREAMKRLLPQPTANESAFMALPLFAAGPEKLKTTPENDKKAPDKAPQQTETKGEQLNADMQRAQEKLAKAKNSTERIAAFVELLGTTIRYIQSAFNGTLDDKVAKQPASTPDGKPEAKETGNTPKQNTWDRLQDFARQKKYPKRTPAADVQREMMAASNTTIEKNGSRIAEIDKTVTPLLAQQEKMKGDQKKMEEDLQMLTSSDKPDNELVTQMQQKITQLKQVIEQEGQVIKKLQDEKARLTDENTRLRKEVADDQETFARMEASQRRLAEGTNNQLTMTMFVETDGDVSFEMTIKAKEAQVKPDEYSDVIRVMSNADGSQTLTISRNSLFKLAEGLEKGTVVYDKLPPVVRNAVEEKYGLKQK